MLGRLRRRGERAARAGTGAALLLARRRRWRGLYVLASGEEVAALPEEAVDEVLRAVDAGIPVEVLVLDFAWDATPVPLPEGVAVHRFWEDAAPGHDTYVPGTEPANTTASPVPRQDGGWLPGRYRNGLPVAAVDKIAAATRVERYGPSGLAVRRDELDQRGALVRVVDLNAGDGAEVGQRYFDASGACWLSVGVGGGARGRAVRHLPRPAEYPSLAAVQAEWAARRVAAAVSPVVVSAGPASSAVEKQVRRTVLTRR